MALILNIESATEVCSVALADERGLIDLLENSEGRSHALLLTVFIQDLLKKNKISVDNLDAIAISMGPGSYTGLRIGVSAAKGLCFGADKPLLAVSTLQSMAFGFLTNHFLNGNIEFENAWYCPMIDAKRLEVYTAFFDRNGELKVGTSAVILTDKSFEEILSQRKIFFFGNGAQKFSELINHPNALFYNDYKISSRDMIHLSQKIYSDRKFEDVAYFEPFYLKNFLATVPKNKVIQKN